MIAPTPQRFCRFLCVALATGCLLITCPHANAIQAAHSAEQVKQQVGVSFANPAKHRWKIGVKIATGGDALRDMLITMPVPTEWPEQSVAKVDEDIPIQFRNLKARTLDGGVQQVIAKLGTIPPNSVVEMSLTFEISVSEILAPADPTVFVIPKTVPKDVKDFLGVSPRISFRNSKFLSEVRGIAREHELAWNKIEAIYDWVRENIQQNDAKPSDSLDVFQSKTGCSEDLVGVFVAMCRGLKVPARTVWVDGNQYAEFYLQDGEKNGHWIPCNVAGLREFGSISEPRIIIQKGDNFRVPEKKERQKFVAEYAKGKSRSKPRVQFYRELLPAE